MVVKRKSKIFSNTPFLLISSIFLQSFSFLSIKFSTLQDGIYVYLLLGLAFFFLGLRSIVWQILLKCNELSKVYPFASLVQVLILVYAIVFFNENVTINNIKGLFIMISGVYFMTDKH